MNEQNPAIPPPPRAAAGCLGVGCMTFAGFVLFLVIVVIAGGAWGIHHLRKNYSSGTPLQLPEAQSESQTTSREITTPPPVPTPPQPADVPVAPEATPLPTITPRVAYQTGDVEQRWKNFQRAAKHGERAHIELTADEINALIANDKNSRGHAFVTIQDNVGHVTVSIPLKELPLMNGRYLNGQATIQASPDGDPAKVQITDVQIGNSSVPDDFLDRRIFGWDTLRGYVTKWLDDQNVSSLRVENNRVIGDTSGR